MLTWSKYLFCENKRVLMNILKFFRIFWARVVKKNIKVLLVVFYVGVCGYFYYYQNTFLFHPEMAPRTDAPQLSKYAMEWVHEGVKHHGWYIHGEEKKPLIVYMGGNSEIISKNLLHFYKRFASEYDILSIEYRGFGGSDGSPDEKSLIADNVALIHEWMHRYGYTPDNIVLVGRSLGSGVAVQVAQRINPRGIILVTPFDSINALAKQQYPYIPVDLLNHNAFLSVQHAPSLRMPGLFIIAGNDAVTPPANGLILAEKMGHSPWIAMINTATHNNIYQFPQVWCDIQVFLKSLFESGNNPDGHYLSQAHYHLNNA